jgi:hypothetical protein
VSSTLGIDSGPDYGNPETDPVSAFDFALLCFALLCFALLFSHSPDIRGNRSHRRLEKNRELWETACA